MTEEIAEEVRKSKTKDKEGKDHERKAIYQRI